MSDITHLMIHTVDLQAQQPSKTPTGGVQLAWVTIASAVPCRVGGVSPWVAKQIYGKFDATKQKRVLFETDYSLKAGSNRVVFNGEAYDVHSVLNEGGSLNRLYGVDVVKLPQ